MVSKNTILSENRLKDIEDILAAAGKIATAADIHKAIGSRYTKNVFKKRVFELKKKGWLIPLKRGLYFVSDISSRGFVNISPFAIASAYNKDSYVSLDSALSFYGLFEQMLRATLSVTANRTRTYKFQENTYKYIRIDRRLYFGYKTENVDGYYIKVAELEKLILDYLYFKSDTYSIDLLLEKLRKAKERLDTGKLFNYAAKFPVSVRRKLGFLLDMIGIDTSRLYESLGRKGYNKLTSRSNKFNAKWRIYYEDRFNQQGPAGDIK